MQNLCRVSLGCRTEQEPNLLKTLREVRFFCVHMTRLVYVESATRLNMRHLWAVTIEFAARLFVATHTPYD
jgi:hypothetical protein